MYPLRDTVLRVLDPVSRDPSEGGTLRRGYPLGDPPGGYPMGHPLRGVTTGATPGVWSGPYPGVGSDSTPVGGSLWISLYWTILQLSPYRAILRGLVRHGQAGHESPAILDPTLSHSLPYPTHFHAALTKDPTSSGSCVGVVPTPTIQNSTRGLDRLLTVTSKVVWYHHTRV